MALVSGSTRYMRIHPVVPPGGGLKLEWGCRRQQFVADLSGYFFGKFRYKASTIIYRYATPCRRVIDCKMNELE